jgi:hypothetical protein
MGAPKGTVILLTGGGGTGSYSGDFTYGQQIISQIVAAGFTAVELRWTGMGGWLSGPGGPRKLACRFATAAKWIYENVHVGGSANPFCATGNSGGSGAIAYALAHYGLGALFDMVEPTSGPPFGRIDHGCICDQPPVPTACGTMMPECYGGAAASILDPAYGSAICSSAGQTHDMTNAALFLMDSVVSPDATLSYPCTDVHNLYGGMDGTSAVPLGYDWISKVTSKKTVACLANDMHPIPSAMDGAQMIANDLIMFCKKQ